MKYMLVEAELTGWRVVCTKSPWNQCILFAKYIHFIENCSLCNLESATIQWSWFIVQPEIRAWIFCTSDAAHSIINSFLSLCTDLLTTGSIHNSWILPVSLCQEHVAKMLFLQIILVDNTVPNCYLMRAEQGTICKARPSINTQADY